MAEPKTIYCPKCGRKVATYDGRQTINPIGKCKKCNKLVEYNIMSRKTFFRKNIEMTSSAGKTFF